MSRPLSKDAFAIMACCPYTGNNYGITVDKISNGEYRFIWAFPIDKDKAHREGYDSRKVKGRISYDDGYPGCPHCGTPDFFQCGNCGAINCYKGEKNVTCGSCGNSGDCTEAVEFEIKGGGY